MAQADFYLDVHLRWWVRPMVFLFCCIARWSARNYYKRTMEVADSLIDFVGKRGVYVTCK